MLCVLHKRFLPSRMVTTLSPNPIKQAPTDVSPSSYLLSPFSPAPEPHLFSIPWGCNPRHLSPALRHDLKPGELISSVPSPGSSPVTFSPRKSHRPRFTSNPLVTPHCTWNKIQTPFHCLGCSTAQISTFIMCWLVSLPFVKQDEICLCFYPNRTCAYGKISPFLSIFYS